VSYVTLKHALAEIALDVTEHLDRAWIADALLAYAESSRDGHRVSVAAIARAAGAPADEVRRSLEATRLFEVVGDGDDGGIGLAGPFRAFLPYLSRQAARTAAAVRLLRAARPETVPLEIWRAAALFNVGLFFECHEYLEDVWRSTPGPERAFYHGLVQAAAGCYHLEKRNAHGARTLLAKAIAKLEPYAPTHRAVEVTAFLAGLRRVLSRLDGTPARLPPSGRTGAEIVFPALALAGFPRTRHSRGHAAGTPPLQGPSR
jgi:hypothetical protein